MSPDFNRLQAVNEELEQLEERGVLTKTDFDRLFEEARGAVGAHEEFLEGILMTGDRLGFVKLGA